MREHSRIGISIETIRPCGSRGTMKLQTSVSCTAEPTAVVKSSPRLIDIDMNPVQSASHTGEKGNMQGLAPWKPSCRGVQCVARSSTAVEHRYKHGGTSESHAVATGSQDGRKTCSYTEFRRCHG